MTWNFKERPELPNSVMDFYYWQSPHKQILTDFKGKCIKVHDGDTITVRTTFRDFDFPVRFFGTDAPELNAPRGHEVRNWLKTQIEGDNIDILVDRKNRVGKWGRILGKVSHRGLDIGDQMLRLGLVTTFEDRRPDQIPNINLELAIKRWF